MEVAPGVSVRGRAHVSVRNASRPGLRPQACHEYAFNSTARPLVMAPQKAADKAVPNAGTAAQNAEPAPAAKNGGPLPCDARKPPRSASRPAGGLAARQAEAESARPAPHRGDAAEPRTAARAPGQNGDRGACPGRAAAAPCRNRPARVMPGPQSRRRHPELCGRTPAGRAKAPRRAASPRSAGERWRP